MKVLKECFDKKEISTLEQQLFGGRIFVILNEEDCNKAVSYLLSQRILGIDTETRPSFTKGRHHKVALLQVSSHDTCFLFRLNFIGIPPALKALLEDKSVLKIGLSLKDDILSLSKRQPFTPGNFLDLQQYVTSFGIKDMSLQKLYANVFGRKISKRQQLTNWENQILTDAQKLYAATDAWACIRIYEELERLRVSGDYILERQEDNVENAKDE